VEACRATSLSAELAVLWIPFLGEIFIAAETGRAWIYLCTWGGQLKYLVLDIEDHTLFITNIDVILLVLNLAEHGDGRRILDNFFGPLQVIVHWPIGALMANAPAVHEALTLLPQIYAFYQAALVQAGRHGISERAASECLAEGVWLLALENRECRRLNLRALFLQ